MAASVALWAGCGGASKKDGASASTPSGLPPGAGGPQSAGGTASQAATQPNEHQLSPDARSVYNDGLQAAKAGALAKAEQAFKNTVQLDPKAPQPLYNLGVLAERKGDDETARRYYLQALSVQEDYAPAVLALIKLDLRTGNGTKAVDFGRAKAEKFSKDKWILAAYAEALIGARRYKDAIGVSKDILRVDERDADGLLAMAKANLGMGRLELAESVFDQVLAVDPNRVEVFFLRAGIRLGEGQKAAAIEEYKKVLAKQPDHVEALNNLANMYLLSGNYAQAAELLGKAVTLAPSIPELRLNYGNALRGAGKWPAAKTQLLEARKISNRFAAPLFNLALVYYVAEELDGMDRTARLNESKKLFAQYKSEMGSALTKDDPVAKYLKEVQMALDREAKRIQTEKDRVVREGERAKQREAEEARKAAEAAEAAKAPKDGKAEEKKKDEKKPAEDGWY
ncbi:MAG: tetratricopeptide repeat protein [Myxococcota bacterium]|jgi:tetratricopeptide (TPR) repeat protein|nr:tetratricopeptide repeat protein [Myxococcota bacterium]